MEHWLPLFHEKLETIFDYVSGAVVSLDSQVGEAKAARLELIRDYYEARAEARRMKAVDASPYKPLKPEALYVVEEDWSAALQGRAVRAFTGFSVPDGLNLGAKQGRNFAQIGRAHV